MHLLLCVYYVCLFNAWQCADTRAGQEDGHVELEWTVRTSAQEKTAKTAGRVLYAKTIITSSFPYTASKVSCSAVEERQPQYKRATSADSCYC
jgi:hypothetical protein